MRFLKLFLLPLLAVPLLAIAAENPEEERLVVLGGPITEIVFALNNGTGVVAVDQSSQYPVAARALPQVGYVRAISAEGVLSMNPSRIIASTALGPAAAVKQLEAAGIPLTLVPPPTSAESLSAAIDTLGKAVRREKEASALIAKLEKDLAEVRKFSTERPAPTVVFLMGLGGSVTAAGSDTQADGIISLAGGKNLFSEFRGYKTVSEEAILQARPDFILVASMGPAAEHEPKKVLERLGYKSADALDKTKVVSLDITQFLIIGPRAGETAMQLARIFAGQDAEQSRPSKETPKAVETPAAAPAPSVQA